MYKKAIHTQTDAAASHGKQWTQRQRQILHIGWVDVASVAVAVAAGVA